jgi:hypothetical protein
LTPIRPDSKHPHKRDVMRILVGLGIILLVLWAILWIGFRIVSGLIHLIVVVAIILLIIGLLRRGASAIGGRRT